MEIVVRQTKEEMGSIAASKGAALIREALDRQGHASIIVATGSSQFEMLSALTSEEIDWSRVTAFHLDEYIGLPISHPASFRKYLKERFVDLVPLKEFHYIDGEADPENEISYVFLCNRVNPTRTNQLLYEMNIRTNILQSVYDSIIDP